MNPSSKLLSIILFFPLTALGWPSSGSMIAYLDTEQIIIEMDEYEVARKKIEALHSCRFVFPKQDSIRAELEQYYNNCVKRLNGGCVSPKEQMEMESKLGEMQEALNRAGEEAAELLSKKEDEIIAIVYQVLNKAVANVAQTKGYTYVIDKKYLLYSNQGISIDNEVRKELGLTLISVDEVINTPISSMLIAYVSKDSILLQMESYKKVKTKVWAYGDSLKTELEKLQKEAEAFYASVMKRAQSSDDCFSTDKKRMEPEAQLQQMQENLQQKAVEADLKLAKREAMLLQPVYKEFKAALASIAEERDYHYIIDKKQVLYDNGGIDATTSVLAYLKNQ